jgi:hypothetical protein
VLLAASGALNVVLGLRLAAWRPSPPPVHPETSEPGASRAGPGADGPRRSGSMLDLYTPLALGHERPATFADAGAADETDLGHEVLCEIAREQSRQRWEAQRDGILRALRTQLADAAQRERKTADKVAALQGVLGLGTEEARAFAEAYAPIGHGRLDAIGARLEHEPADWSGAFDQLRGLFTDEDALVRERYGDERAAKLRAAEREERLVLLAIFATLAGRPWEDALR